MSGMKQWQRVVDLEEGMAMVVTDLHGDWDAYQRYRDRFLLLRAQNSVHYLILTGDLIHSYGDPAERDRSLDIVLDVLALKAQLGDYLICLLGNHELPHIYTITLQKGDDLFTPRFEAAVGEHRPEIVAFFESLPFYVRTEAGVTVCHAGATAAISTQNGVKRLFNLSHRRILQEAAKSITPEERPLLMRALRETNNMTYYEMVRNFFAVTGLDDPRYDDFLIGTVASAHPEFELLWSALFTRNEYEYGHHGYSILLSNMLQALSADFHPQRVLVTGHIDCKGGYKLVTEQQLRLASAKHAEPRQAGLYLLFDVEKPVKTAGELLPRLSSVFT